MLTARQMHAADATARAGSLLGVPGARFGAVPPDGEAGAGLDYPDLGLLGPSGGWASADLVIAGIDPGRLRDMIDRMNHDTLIVGQWFLVEDEQQLGLIENTASELRLADRVHVQTFDHDAIAAG